MDILNPIYNPAVMKPSNGIHYVIGQMFHNVKKTTSDSIYHYIETTPNLNAFIRISCLENIIEEVTTYAKENC